MALYGGIVSTFGKDIATPYTQYVCYGATPIGSFNTQSATGGTPSYTYQWQICTTSSGGTFTDISSANGLYYYPPVLTQNTWFRRKVTDSISSVAYSNVLTYIQQTTQLSAVWASLTYTQPTSCGGSNGTITFNSASGGSGSYEYSVDYSGSIYHFQSSPIFTGLISPWSYKCAVRDANNTGCLFMVHNGLLLTGPLATITTTSITSIEGMTATGGGNVTTSGCSTITARGVCWNTTGSPTTSDSKTINGTGIGSFTSNLTGLTSGVLYYVRAYVINSEGTAYGNQVSFTTAILPTVTFSNVDTITNTTATASGNVTSDGGATVTARGVCYSHTNPTPTLSDSYAVAGSGTGIFSANIVGLTKGTSYYFRSYATNSAGTAYSSYIPNYTTWREPYITTTTITSIATTTATGGGNSISDGSDGGAPVTARGVCWATTSNPTTANSKTSNGTGTVDFSSSITGLTQSTLYYIRAYATNSVGTTYGNQLTFTTLGTPILTTTPITNINLTTATGGGNVTVSGSAVTARGICWATTNNPTTANSKTSNGTGLGSYSSSLTSLTQGTLYYVRAYATNTQGTAYGNQVSFTTLIPIIPTVITTTTTSISYTTVSTGGVVTDQGIPATVTARGVCYGTSINPTIAGLHTIDGSGIGSFISNLTGLASNTLYHIRSYATNSTGTAYGDDQTFTTLALALATLTTTPISSITTSTATGGGNISSDGGTTVTVRGICYGTSPNPTTANTKITNGSGTGSYSCNLTGLASGTTYYVRAYATNTTGTAYGSQVSFTTLALPIVTTTAISSIAQTTATGGGNITSDGGTSVTERGVCWNTSTSPTISNSHTSDGTGTGSYSSSITGLTQGVTYYVRSYATNSVGTVYGSEVSFTTLDYPIVTTTAISSIAQTTAIGGGNVTSDGGATTTKGICWNTSTNPTTANSKTINGTGTGSYSSSLTGLTAGILYYVRSYATNSVGTVYGSQVTFTTLKLPTVTTTTPTLISYTSVSTGGNVTDQGILATVTARGVCYGTSINPTIAGSHTTNGSGSGAFTSNLTGLTSNTLYHIRSYATNSTGTAYGDDQTFTTLTLVIATISTSPISSITTSTAIGGGDISSDGGTAVTARGICYNTTGSPTIASTKTTNGSGTGSYTSNLTGLVSGTTYYVKAYATNSTGTAYGTEVSFTALNVPSLSTTTITSISLTGATGGGNISGDGGTTVTARGIVYSTNSNPTLADSYTNNGSGLGSYSATLTGLLVNTTYYVRSYATNTAGTGYGNQISFNTANPSPISLVTITVTDTTAIAHWVLPQVYGTSIKAEIKLHSDSSFTVAATLASTATGYTYTGLSHTTNYDIRVTLVGSNYPSNIYNFTTLASLPSISTTTITNISSTGSTGGGNITSDGGAAITARGICWSLFNSPTITDAHTSNGTGAGLFSSVLSGLLNYTLYYVRAYATNSVGTTYGNEVSFTTLLSPSPVIVIEPFCQKVNYLTTNATCGNNNGSIRINNIDYLNYYSFSLTDTFNNSYTSAGLLGDTFFVPAGYYFLTATPIVQGYKACTINWIPIADGNTTMTLNMIVKNNSQASSLTSAGTEAGRIFGQWTGGLTGTTHNYYLYFADKRIALNVTGSSDQNAFIISPVTAGDYYGFIENEYGCRTLTGKVHVETSSTFFNLSGIKKVFLAKYFDEIDWIYWSTSDESFFQQTLDKLKFQSAKLKSFLNVQQWYSLPAAEDTTFSQKMSKVRQGFIFENNLTMSFTPTSYLKWLATQQLLDYKWVIVFLDLNDNWWVFGHENQGAKVNVYSQKSDQNYYIIEFTANSGDKFLTGIDYKNYVLPIILNI